MHTKRSAVRSFPGVDAPRGAPGELSKAKSEVQSRAGVPSASPSHSQGLDGLRAVAAGLVLLFHAGFPLANAGWLGVDMFFVLSGFLITTLLERERVRTGRIALPQFWGRRLLRLMPLYWLYLLGVFVLLALTHNGKFRLESGWTPMAYAGYLASYLANYVPLGGLWEHQPLTSHLWSLSVEEQFYLLWPVLLSLVAGRRMGLGVALLGVTLSLATSLFATNPPTLLLHTRGIGLMVGCAAAFVTSQVAPRRALWMGAAGVSGATCALALFGIITYLSVAHGYQEEAFMKNGLLFLFDVSVALLVAELWYRPFDRAGRLLGIPVLAGIGKISYGIYLFHMLVHTLVWGLPLTGLEDLNRPLRYGLRMAAYLGGTWVLASLSYRFAESPFLRLKDRLRV